MLSATVSTRCARACLALALFASSAGADPLELVIDLSAQTIDWVDGTSVSRMPGVDDTRFGTMSGVDAAFTSPLASYAGPGVLTQVALDLDPTGRAIIGVGLVTTGMPGVGDSFSGTPDVGASPVFAAGGFDTLSSLGRTSYLLPPVGSWDSGVRVTVVPCMGVVPVALACVVTGARRRR